MRLLYLAIGYTFSFILRVNLLYICKDILISSMKYIFYYRKLSYIDQRKIIIFNSNRSCQGLTTYENKDKILAFPRPRFTYTAGNFHSP